MPTADLTDPETFRAVTVTGLFAVVYPLISACLAFMTRHAAAAMLLTLVVAFFPLVMGELGSSWWAEVAVRFAPGGPMESLTGQAIPGTVGYLSPALAVLVHQHSLAGTVRGCGDHQRLASGCLSRRPAAHADPGPAAVHGRHPAQVPDLERRRRT